MIPDPHTLRSLCLQLASAAEIPAIYDLDRRCLGGMWSLSTYHQELSNPSSRIVCLLHHRALMGFGCLWTILEESHITLLAVDAVHQRQGLGRLLVWGLLDAARHNQSEWATLEVRCSNVAALKVYGYFGFQTVGTRKAYYPDGEDALILWCKGLHQPEFLTRLMDWRQALETKLHSYGWQIANL